MNHQLSVPPKLGKRDIVHIYSRPDDSLNLTHVGEVNSVDYKLIRNRIIGHGEGGVKGLVTTLLQKSGWVLERDDRNIFSPVIEIFMQTSDLDLPRLTDFVYHKSQFSYLTNAIKRGAEKNLPFNIIETASSALKFAPDESITRLVNELWQITTCVNQIGIGPGEICLSILSNAHKSLKGDLYFPNIGDIEVKSTYGRLGSGDNALLAIERLKTAFETKNMSLHNVRMGVAKRTGKKLRNTHASEMSWNEIVQAFFLYDWKFNFSTICLALSYLSTQKLDYTRQSQLIAGLRELEDTYAVVTNLSRFSQRTDLIRIVLAIQLCTYQTDHKFPFLLAVNKKTKDAHPIKFPSDDLGENIVSVYEQLLLSNRFSSNLAIDSEGTRKGVEINFV